MGTFSGAVGEASIYGGAGADTLNFAAAVDGATVDLGAGIDLISFDNVYVNGSTVFGGAAADTFSGGISAGASGVSFWGGTGADTFNFSTGISNASGTAYFWNADAGTDSINLSAATAVTQNLGFGVSTGSGLIINFGSTSNGFASNSTNLFTFTGTAAGGLVTYSSTTTSTIFINAGGSTVTFMGGAGLSASFYNAGFTSAAATGALKTAIFGSHSSFPSFS